jgi:hypothetical protein
VLELKALMSELVRQLGFFDVHVFEFAGLEDFRAFQAFHELRVLITRDDPHTRVLALAYLASLLGELRRRD